MSEYEVEKVVDSRLNKKGKMEYFIKWVGYDSSQNTWEPEKNLASCRDMIEKYNQEASRKNFSQSKATRGRLSGPSKRADLDEMDEEDSDSVVSAREEKKTELGKQNGAGFF